MVADLFRAEGFSVHVSMATRDGGHDLLLTMDPRASEGHAEPPLFAVQIKHYKERRVSVETIRSAVGSVVLAGRRAKGLIVASSQPYLCGTGAGVGCEPKGHPRARVIDGPDLERRVLQHPNVVNKYFRQGDEA